jgi:hypothetical protein
VPRGNHPRAHITHQFLTISSHADPKTLWCCWDHRNRTLRFYGFPICNLYFRHSVARLSFLVLVSRANYIYWTVYVDTVYLWFRLTIRWENVNSVDKSRDIPSCPLSKKVIFRNLVLWIVTNLYNFCWRSIKPVSLVGFFIFFGFGRKNKRKKIIFDILFYIPIV